MGAGARQGKLTAIGCRGLTVRLPHPGLLATCAVGWRDDLAWGSTSRGPSLGSLPRGCLNKRPLLSLNSGNSGNPDTLGVGDPDTPQEVQDSCHRPLGEPPGGPPG